MRSLRQQVEDALYYLERPTPKEGDREKAIDILSSIARGKKAGAALVKAIRESNPTTNAAGVPWGSLKGLVLVIAIGHEPGAGASGERAWNGKLAKSMKKVLELCGATVYIYFHKVKSYSARQNKLGDYCDLVGAFACWELHYDAYHKPSANGHHFKYLGAKKWALYTQEEWANHYPHSVARNSYGDGPGLHHATSGNGSGFVKRMPCWALLPEPFFNSNDAEREFFKPRIDEIAIIYCIGLARFANFKSLNNAK